MSYGLNVEMHKQTEIAKRLNAIIAQLMPFLSQEHQQQVATAVERAKQVTMSELNAVIGDEDNLQKLLNIFVRDAKELNIVISVQKTKSLTISREPRRLVEAAFIDYSRQTHDKVLVTSDTYTQVKRLFMVAARGAAVAEVSTWDG
ncbi:hypothetical protein HUJ04_010837 [Dendroctonus ponderosae]|nr:hypothetical protein HUJ04_010837 [Dendroctonus ponderosae]